MSKNKDKKRMFGNFTLLNGVETRGELTLKGEKSMLRLVSDEYIPEFFESEAIYGTTDDFKKVSCFQCFTSFSGATFGEEGSKRHSADVFPHLVTLGKTHLQLSEACIKRVYFRVTDIASIFYDLTAFGNIHVTKDNLRQILPDWKNQDQPQMGEHPFVSYFTGKREVCSISTELGLFSVNHNFSYGMGKVEESAFSNSMNLCMDFHEKITIDECIENIFKIRRFLTLLAGRKQGMKSIVLELERESSSLNNFPTLLDLHLSLAPKGPKASAEDKPDWRDLPLDACRRPEEFANVLKHWIIRDHTWRIPRGRYITCIEKGNTYNADRLVAAANIFDILPDIDVPVESKLPANLEQAKLQAKKLFNDIPQSADRDSILGALGRLGKPSLPKKVEYRAAIVTGQFGDKLPNFLFVLKTAVKCRNYFVHGSDFDFKTVEPFLDLLTDALEFVFAASDLMEAGWEADAWIKRSPMMGHSFARFIAGYKIHAQALESAMSEARKKLD